MYALLLCQRSGERGGGRVVGGSEGEGGRQNVERQFCKNFPTHPFSPFCHLFLCVLWIPGVPKIMANGSRRLTARVKAVKKWHCSLKVLIELIEKLTDICQLANFQLVFRPMNQSSF